MVDVNVNWRDAYKHRADLLSASIAIENAAARSSRRKSDDLANAAFRESIKNSPVKLRQPSTTQPEPSDELDARIEKGGWDGFLASTEKSLNEPVVKGLLDFISIGGYTSAAIANAGVETGKAAAKDGILGGIGEGLDQVINHNPVVMGVKAAFGDDDSTRTYADVIKNAQGAVGADTENDAAKWTQGIGGFAGDVALDPLTYLTLGVAPIIKGAAVGAREGTKAAKTVARGALADAEAKGASLQGTEISRIAENSEGVIGSAISGAKKEYGSWKEGRKATKEGRKAIRAERANRAGVLDKDSASVGIDQRKFQEELDVRLALRQKEQAEFAAAKVERDARIAEERFADSLKTPDEVVEEAKADIDNPESVPPGIKEEDVPHIENDVIAPEDINKSDIKTEVNLSVPEKEVIAPPKKPADDLIKEVNGPIIEKFEKLWKKPKYRDKKLLAALAEPATIRKLKEYAAEEAPVEKGRKKGLGEFTGRTAESKDKKRAQKEAGKTRVKEQDFGPQQVDYGTRIGIKNPDGSVDDDYIFDVDKIADEDSDFDLDKFREYAVSNPDEVLHVQDAISGTSSSIKLEKLADQLENAIADGMYANTINKYLRSNALFFSRFDLANDAADIDADWADFMKAREEWEASKNVPDEVVDEGPEEVGEIDPIQALMQGEGLKLEYEDLPNPNAWSPEKASIFKVAEEDAHLTPQELMALPANMNSTEIKRFIMAAEGGISRGELNELRKFTGKTDPKEVADEFIKMRTLYNKAKNAKPKVEKPKVKTRAEEVREVMQEGENLKPEKATPEKLEEAEKEAAEMANEVASSPVALDEAAQREFRAREYQAALTKELDPDLAGVIDRQHVNDIARQAVKASIEEQTKDGAFKTLQDYRTNTQQIDTGGAWRPDRWGSNSQIAMHKVIWNTVRKLDTAGKWSPTARRKAYMAIAEVADKELRAIGVEPFLNHVSQKVGKQGSTHPVNLSYYDIMKSLHTAGFKTPLDIMTSGARAFIPTQVQGATETIVRMRASGMPEEEIRKRAIKQLVGSEKETEAYGRPSNNGKAADGFTRGRIDAMRFQGKDKPLLPQMTAIRGRVKDARTIVDALMDPTTYRGLNTQMMVNHAAHASALGKNVDDLSQSIVDDLMMMREVNSSGEILGFLNGKYKAIAGAFSPDDLTKAKAMLAKRMEEYMTKAEEISFKEATTRADSIKPTPAVAKENAEKVAKINDDGKPAHESFHKELPKTQPMQQVINKSHVREVEAAEKQALEMAPEGAEDFEVIGASIAAAAMRKIHPFQKFVNPRLGLTDNIYRSVNSGLHSIARQQAEFHGSLLTHVAKYGDEALLRDFKELQRLGREAGVSKNDVNLLPEGSSESMKELYGIVSIMLDRSAYNVFARNGIGAKHFNALAKAGGLPKKWRFKMDADAGTNSTLWMNWEGIEEKGVLDFLSRMHSIAVKASQDIAIAASFSKNFGKTTPGEGMVKIKWTNRSVKDDEESVFYDLIDKDLYYPKDIAMQVTQIDKLMRESRHIDPSTSTGKFIVNVFDPITNALKASQTTVRPGHWVISFVGDLLRNQLAGVNTYQPYKHSANIMLAGKKMLNGEEDEFYGRIASAKALHAHAKSQEINNGFVGSSTGKGVTLFVNGKKVNVNYETMNKLLRDVVMLPKHRGGGVLEDRFLDAGATSKFAKGIEKATDFVTDNDKFSLNEWAARRDNLMRVALAVDFASKRKWKNLTEMKAGMEEYITKWAPTSTDFTSWESKYARRSLLYYTWLRGITPRVMDAAMTRPGVTTIVPKAMYNLAYANGLNPESIGNPFPEEGGMFPDYYKNNVLGPQWRDEHGLWGINPSSPVIEVANTFSKFKAGDPLGNMEGGLGQAASMANPFFRMPWELATSTQAGTNIPIEDKAQYIGDNLGGSYLASLSRATGKTIGTDGILDRTDSAAKYSPEDQAEHAKLQLFNFLTGLKLTDYESDSAMKAAGYDMAEEARRMGQIEARRL